MSYPYGTTGYWEDQLVADLIAANLTALSGFAIEVLGGQVDFTKDQLNRSVSHIIVGQVSINHDSGFQTADPFDMAIVAVIPGGSQRERRTIALNALQAIANWMRSGGSSQTEQTFQPNKTTLERIHPEAVATLIATKVG